jgi:hypothetical protein
MEAVLTSLGVNAATTLSWLPEKLDVANAMVLGAGVGAAVGGGVGLLPVVEAKAPQLAAAGTVRVPRPCYPGCSDRNPPRRSRSSPVPVSMSTKVILILVAIGVVVAYFVKVWFGGLGIAIDIIVVGVVILWLLPESVTGWTHGRTHTHT